jgi:hypothetical protein
MPPEDDMAETVISVLSPWKMMSKGVFGVFFDFLGAYWGFIAKCRI